MRTAWRELSRRYLARAAPRAYAVELPGLQVSAPPLRDSSFHLPFLGRNRLLPNHPAVRWFSASAADSDGIEAELASLDLSFNGETMGLVVRDLRSAGSVSEDGSIRMDSKALNRMLETLGTNGRPEEFWRVVEIMRKKAFGITKDTYLAVSKSFEEERRVLFRPSCSQYNHLRSECFDYGKLCSSLIEDLKNMGNISSMVLCNWQATSSKFINPLSEKYANYADLVQPVLVAVYEMKLGVSLVSSSALQKDYLEKVGGVDIQKIKAEVYSFMQFPRSLLYDSIPVNLKNYEQDSMDEFVYASATTNLWSIELMKKLINYSSETNLEKKISPVLLDNILHYVMLIQTTDHVLYSHILDKACFLVLNCTFDRFAKLWMDMKTQLKAKEDVDQNFKFRTRLIKIEDIMEEELSDNAMDFDERLLSETSKNEQEFSEMMKPVEEDKNIEEEWELIHETFSKSLVRVHSLLYGSIGVVENVFPAQQMQYKLYLF